MNDRFFHLRLSCSYQDDDNNIGDLNIEIETEDGWEKMDLNLRTGGFLMFINGLFSCQHLYMRANCAEHHLVLISATGDMKIKAGEFWDISQADISFNAKLKSGTPTENDITYITERMKHCPVSSNLPQSVHITNSVTFT